MFTDTNFTISYRVGLPMDAKYTDDTFLFATLVLFTTP
jgi:hypothetical protein